MTVLLPGRVAVLVCIVLCSALAVYRLSQERLESVASSVKATPTINSRQNARKLAEVTTAVNYEEPKSLIKKLLSLIYNRYEFGGPHGNKFFMTSNNISPETWDILKFKLATKMLTPGSTFLMTFSGSSVTAGHDNYYAQSYPYIFKKRMSEIFKGVGIELVVHDIALGANNCSPYVLCYESMGGADPDFINWEQVCVFLFGSLFSVLVGLFLPPIVGLVVCLLKSWILKLICPMSLSRSYSLSVLQLRSR